ncbi:MAG: MopE-related protein [Myxococcota bacterium]
MTQLKCNLSCSTQTFWVRLGLMMLMTIGAACSADSPSDTGGGSGEEDTGSGGERDAGDTTSPEDDTSVSSDTALPTDTETEADTTPTEQRTFGSPCRSNLDCLSGFCISSPLGFVCTDVCGSDEDCPTLDGAQTRCRATENFGADGTLVCAPTESTLCQPCFQDANCFGGLCASSPGGSVCGLNCEDDRDCPDGTNCFTFSPAGDVLATPQCLPSNLSCGCTEETAGQTRACVQSDNQGNRCFGEEMCDPSRGWVGCDAPSPLPEVCDGVDNNCNGAVDDGLPSTQACEVSNDFGLCTGFAVCEAEAGYVCRAPEPAAELCDLIDNDCDGEVDEDFRNADGVLSSSAHCGVCGNNCDIRFDLAAETECAVDDQGQAQCVIAACIPGYTLAGPTTCLPLASSLCQPCQSDDACNPEVGDRCIVYGEGQQFCGRSCADDSPFGRVCPSGYTCNADAQCQLESGTCLCGPGDSFIRPCAIPDPNDPANNCVGTLTCDMGALSACVPPEDSCNGFDDDCDGVVDNGLRDPDTEAYISDRHCGRCFNDCILRFSDPMFHADGSCNGLEAAQRGEQPACVLTCDEGWSNVNGLVDDGCECEVLDPVVDVPDRMGLDANCDGIDGEVARGIFVSRTGDDANLGTLDSPVQSIQRAIDLAGEGRDQVYVAAGVYTETVQLRAGVSVYGGYSFDYRRRDIAGNETAIFGTQPSGTVIADGITGAPTVVAGFTLVGADTSAPSGSTYAVYVRNSDGALVLSDNTVRGGVGGPGSRGGSGLEGVDASMGDTAQGQPQRLSTTAVCSNTSANRSNGSVGTQHTCTNEAGTAFATHGGNGGTANCPVFNQPEGSGASGSGTGAGGGGAGGYNQRLELFQTGCVCLVPDVVDSTEVGVPGGDGAGGSGGSAGQGCGATAGRVENGQWIAGPVRSGSNLTRPDSGAGGKGLKGNAGGGGGGGGAGSGLAHGPDAVCNNIGNESIGGGGGGGGAGGCGGDGGLGGLPGGGSFAIFVVFDQPPASLPEIVGNTIERGVGGTGGDGGAGGSGGLGSPGKGAQALADAQLVGLLACSDPGGRGGDGGNGGAGGGGGGGCGGIAAGIYVAGQPTPGNYTTGNTFPGVGRSGPGGRGGPSNGNNGGNGDDGLYVEVAP